MSSPPADAGAARHLIMMFKTDPGQLRTSRPDAAPGAQLGRIRPGRVHILLPSDPRSPNSTGISMPVRRVRSPTAPAVTPRSHCSNPATRC